MKTLVAPVNWPKYEPSTGLAKAYKARADPLQLTSDGKLVESYRDDP